MKSRRRVSRQKDILNLDTRVILLLVPIVGLAAIFASEALPLSLLVIGICILMLLSGAGVSGVKYLVLFTVLISLQQGISQLEVASLNVLFVTLLYIMQRLILFGMLGSFISHTVTTGELVCSLEKLKFPMEVVIPIAVTLRFVPTMQQELGYIKESMKMRGIEASIKMVLTHPVKLMEYILVPLLMRSLKVADELSAAALVRGMDCNRVRTPLYESRWHIGNSLTLLASMAYVVIVCIV